MSHTLVGKYTKEEHAVVVDLEAQMKELKKRLGIIKLTAAVRISGLKVGDKIGWFEYGNVNSRRRAVVRQIHVSRFSGFNTQEVRVELNVTNIKKDGSLGANRSICGSNAPVVTLEN